MLNKLRILLADDEAILRLDLREMLADAGHDIVGEAANGQEAVKLAAELKPDFIIMDVKCRLWTVLPQQNYCCR